MKILFAHNYYQQPGGEDQSYAAEIAMLESFGHQVIQHRVHNDSIQGMSSLGVAARTVWNHSSYREIRALIRTHRPHIAHFNNTFPLISPAAYYAARAEGIPVVQTLRNYRLLCPSAFFLRDEQLCKSCLGKMFAWPGVRHGCYRQDRKATAVVAAMLTTHRFLRTWQNAVDVYIALTEFGRNTFIEGGLPAEKIRVKPNFVYPDPGAGYGQGGYAIFIGRLSEEKGIKTLLEAWRLMKQPVPLKIVGDGPLETFVEEACQQDDRISWLGHQTPETVATLVGDAAFLVFPSLWYEGMPRTMIEAFAKGTPVVASKMGAMEEMITNDQTGIHFQPGQAQELATHVQQLFSNPAKLEQMRTASRTAFEKLYSHETNYDTLMSIYQQALKSTPTKQTKGKTPSALQYQEVSADSSHFPVVPTHKVTTKSIPS